MGVISFARGVPAPECLPVAELADCARAAIERDGASVLSYGPGGGYAPLREWIAARHGVEPARVVITSGSLQGFVFLVEQLVEPGTRVLVEAPTYDRPLKILARLGAEIVGLPMDDDGLQVDALERALSEGEKPAFLYTIATFQNPSGRTLSTERRRRIAELAREHELLVLEDDPYGLVRYEGEAPPTIFELEGGTNVAYASSFSKTIAPGVRVGYFVLPPALAAQIEALAVSTYISPPFLTQAAVYEFVSRGLLRAEPRARHRAARRAPRRDARGARASTCPTARHGAGPKAATSSGSTSRDEAGDLLARGGSRGRHVREGHRLLRRRQRHALASARVQLRLADEIAEGVARLAGLLRGAPATASTL